MRRVLTGSAFVLILLLAAGFFAAEPARVTLALSGGRVIHTDSTWRELVTWVELGMTPMLAIADATRWPAVWMKREKDVGTLAPGRYADIVAVRGNVLKHTLSCRGWTSSSRTVSG